MRRILFIALMAATLLLDAATSRALVDVEGRYWFTDLSGNVTASSGSIVGTNADFVDDLGIDNKENFAEGRITLEVGKHSVRYGYIPLSWSGVKTLSRDITFAGQTFSASTSVESDVKVDYHRLGYRYDIISLMENRLGLVADLKYLDARVNLKDAALGLDEKESIKLPIPTVGLAGQIGLPLLFKVGGEITGITAGSQAYLIDGEASINFKPVPFVVIAGGYRYMKYHVEKNSDLADIVLKGPYLMLKADF